MTGPHRSTRAVLVLGLLAGTLAPAAAAGPVDPANGERLARRWCAGCHLVAPDQTQASPDAPSFSALANAPGRTPEGLADFLTLPGTTHSRMPDLALSRLEIGDIAAYVATLRK